MLNRLKKYGVDLAGSILDLLRNYERKSPYDGSE
jgi:hypothetical protein